MEENFVSGDIKKATSIYLKILVNYLQLIVIIQNLEIKWPSHVKNYFNFYENFGTVSTQGISFDCILKDYDYNIETIYVETIFDTLLPGITLIFAGSILTVFHIYNKKSNQTIRFIVIMIVSSIYLQPAIIKILYANLVCKTIDNASFLKVNLSINCNTDTRNKWLTFYIYFI